jgi:hypothetical protein
MSEFKYYTPGSWAPTGEPVYGLYQPLLDCFLFVTADYTLAGKLVDIMSSRFDLFICEIGVACNFKGNLLNNSCCENWSLSNSHTIKTAPLSKNTVTQADRLRKSRRTVAHDINKEKQWILMCAHWIDCLNQLKYPYANINNWTTNILNLTDSDFCTINFNLLEKTVIKLLYINTDFETTDREINKLITEFRVQ